MQKQTIAVIFGTRPDTIKLAPVILELQRAAEEFQVVTIATAQHRQMLDQVPPTRPSIGRNFAL